VQSTQPTVWPYRWQHCANGSDITGQPDAERHADEIRAWSGAHGDLCIVAVSRTPRGRWRIASSDFDVPLSVYDRRFREPVDAVAYMGRRARMVVTEAVCRCGEPDAECD
jgi:hypothetical protein